MADLSRTTLRWFESRDEALAAEAEAIRTESPAFNVVHAGIRPRGFDGGLDQWPAPPVPADNVAWNRLKSMAENGLLPEDPPEVQDDDWTPPDKRTWNKMRDALKNQRREIKAVKREAEERIEALIQQIPGEDQRQKARDRRLAQAVDHVVGEVTGLDGDDIERLIFALIKNYPGDVKAALQYLVQTRRIPSEAVS
jgi:hypothetical protein